MNNPGEILNRNALRDGDVICRRGTALVSKAIMLATGGKWSHDAIIIRNPKTGALAIGDAIGGATDECQVTPLVEWERGCREDGHRIIVLRPAYATEEQGQRAAAFWVNHIAGQRYDKVAIWRLGLKAIFGDWFSGKVGMMSRFFCTGRGRPEPVVAESQRHAAHDAEPLRGGAFPRGDGRADGRRPKVQSESLGTQNMKYSEFFAQI
jgi:hypothetical protein